MKDSSATSTMQLNTMAQMLQAFPLRQNLGVYFEITVDELSALSR